MVLLPTFHSIILVDPADGVFLVGDGTDWVGESGATARTSIGLGTADNVEFAISTLASAVIGGATYPVRIGESPGWMGLELPAGTVGFTSNAYYTDDYRYRGTNFAASVNLSDGKLVFRNAASGTPGNAITWADRFVVDATGIVTVATWQGVAVADAYIASAATWNAKIANVSEDTTPTLGGDLDAGGNTIHFGAAENTQTPTDPATATIDLGAENHHTLDCGSAVGAITLTLTVPPGPTAGTIIIEQDAAPKDITWALSAGTVKWLGTEPTWSGDTSKWRIVSWRWDGTFMYLSATETS